MIEVLKVVFLLKASEIRILIIDDEPLTMKAVASNFEVFGFQVERAESVEQGRKILAEKEIHIVLIDLHMPKEGGDTFIKEVRAKNWSSPAVFLMTGDFSVDAESILHEGADGVLLKPFDAAATRSLIQQACVGPKQMWMTPLRKDPVATFQVEVEDLCNLKEPAMFGRGGIFFEGSTAANLEDVVQFEVFLKKESQMVSGRGVVRWIREQNPSRRSGVGVEIKYLDDVGRAYFLEWREKSKPKAFIPKGY